MTQTPWLKTDISLATELQLEGHIRDVQNLPPDVLRHAIGEMIRANVRQQVALESCFSRIMRLEIAAITADSKAGDDYFRAMAADILGPEQPIRQDRGQGFAQVLQRWQRLSSGWLNVLTILAFLSS